MREKREIFKRHERPGDAAMERLGRDGKLVGFGTYNANGARIARGVYKALEAEGLPSEYNLVYGSGWAMSGMNLGFPDMGFHQLSEVAPIAEGMVNQAYPLEVMLDAETGFGNKVTLTRTVRKFHELGVAIAHLEDQDPEQVRRCGNVIGKSCVSIEEFCMKIESWLTTTRTLDSSMRLMVRTDALTAVGGGLENAIERGKRYMDVEVGGLRPTMLWADAMMDPEIIDKWIAAMRAHDPDMILAINYSPNKDWTGYYRTKFNRDPPTYEDLYREGRGFQVMFHTIIQARADGEATYNTCYDFARNGAKALWKLHERQKGHPVEDAQAMIDFPMWQEYEQEIGGDAARERYEKSEGYKGEKK